MICMLLTGRTVRVGPLKGTRYDTYLTHSIPIPLTRLNRTRLMRDRQLSGRCVARALSLRMRTVRLRREPTRWGSEMPAESSTTHAAAGPSLLVRKGTFDPVKASTGGNDSRTYASILL
jgi:hypothetical protein